jgi:hypothetical protein
MRMKFNMLTDINILKYRDISEKEKDRDNILSFPYELWKTYDSSIKGHSQRSGILQDLFFLARTLKEDINLKNI